MELLLKRTRSCLLTQRGRAFVIGVRRKEGVSFDCLWENAVLSTLSSLNVFLDTLIVTVMTP